MWTDVEAECADADSCTNYLDGSGGCQEYGCTTSYSTPAGEK